MIEIEKPRIETAELTEDGKYGKFVVEPLERGFGNTLGNSLRRVLLSSLEGCAVTSLKIDGVLHEFSTITGVKEDVTEIVLNMKSLVAKLVDVAPKVVTIDAEGPCEVTAASIKADSEVEILNPELHIATLGEGAKLSMEITIDKEDGANPFTTDTNHPFFKKMSEAMADAYASPTKFIGCGASIPGAELFRNTLGNVPILLTGLEDPECNAHGENESLYLPDFESGIVAEALFFVSIS